MKNKAVFLDRDGTINIEKNYLYRIEDFVFLPGVIEALRLIQSCGYLLIIITNQSGIARGYYEEADFQKLNEWMLETLKEQGVKIDAVYYCPHHPEGKIERYRIKCHCRKPKTGMFYQAVEDFSLDLAQCFAVGDKIRDCSICENTMCQGFLVGENEKPEVIRQVKAGEIRNVEWAANLLECVESIAVRRTVADYSPCS